MHKVVGQNRDESRESCAAGPQEVGRHAVSTFRIAVTRKIAVKDSKRCNIAALFERLKTELEGGTDETKSF